MATRAFISHSSQDREWVDSRIVEPLRSVSLPHWYSQDSLQGGDQWVREITKALKTCDAFVIILSPASITSTWVETEVHYAFNHGIEVIPILKERCDASDLHLKLGLLQFIDFPALGDRAAIEQLLKRLGIEIPKLRNSSHPRPPQASPTVNVLRERFGDRIFRMATFEVPYVRLLGTMLPGQLELYEGEVEVETLDRKFTLPECFAKFEVSPNIFDDRKCRLLSFHPQRVTPEHYRLRLSFEETCYRHYLKSGDHLDEHSPGDGLMTLRDFVTNHPCNGYDFSQWPLPNICGAGVFLLTSDEKVIVSERNQDLAVYPSRFSYSASGTLNFHSEGISPFAEMARECLEESCHDIGPNVQLFGIGLDERKLYFQLSFFERTALTSSRILQRAVHAPRPREGQLRAVPFDVDSIVPLIMNHSWEPAAAADLLTLLAKKFGERAVEAAIDPQYVENLWTVTMIEEWKTRSRRQGDLAVMSARYPMHEIEHASRDYIRALLDFIGSDVDGRDVLEVGAGIGRLTRPLAERAARLTCLDLCPEMLERNRRHLGSLSDRVEYHQAFIQKYVATRPHAVTIVSLVLIHNVEPKFFDEAIRAIRCASETVFLCEHIAQESRRATPHTLVRSREELLHAFQSSPEAPRFRPVREFEYRLFNDRILFLKLERE